MQLTNTRKKRAKLNIAVSILAQIVALFCGLIVPRLLLGAFGSEAYGATTSIAQFLSYITLIEGGIGMVARAALYKPLAEGDTQTIANIMREIRKFFRIIGAIFIVYTIVLACTYQYISQSTVFDYMTTFWLVIIISLGTAFQYFFGISNSTLINSDQRKFVIDILSIITVSLNCLMVFILVYLNSSLLVVKFVSALVYLISPFGMWVYVKKRYSLPKVEKTNEVYLKDKRSGTGQHLAYFLNNNIDVSLLTFMGNLVGVAVYAVYNGIVSHLKNLIGSLISGMEPVFGDMFARGEMDKLKRAYDKYELIISIASVFSFSVCASMILPFIDLYTAGITDADYHQPLFAMFITAATMMYTLSLPSRGLSYSTGHIKQTGWGAYGEAIINLALSVSFVFLWGIAGVAIATFIAATYRLCFHGIYNQIKIFGLSPWQFIKREFINVGCSAACVALGLLVVHFLNISNYGWWVLVACIVSVISIVLVIGTMFLFYRDDMKSLAHEVIHKRKKTKIAE